nr:polyprotein [chieh-qua endornavirus]
METSPIMSCIPSTLIDVSRERPPFWRSLLKKLKLKSKYHNYKSINRVVKPSIVRREFSTKLQGWIKLPRNCQMTLNKNPFETSFRKVFKENKNLIFDKNKIKLVPAIRGVRKFRDTGGSIAANFRFEDPLAGVINFEALHPLDIAKVYYNVINDGCEIWKQPHRPISDYLNLTKHEGIDDEDEEEEMFLDSNNLDNNLIIRVVGPGRGNCTSDMLEVLSKLVARFGGYEKYYNTYLETQHKHFGYLQRGDDGKYSFEGVKFNPLKKCSVCKYMNHYDELIRGLRMVHFSLKHYRPKSKVVTDDFKTIYNKGDIIEDVPWRCGYCFADLNLQVHTQDDPLQTIVQYVVDHLFVLMGDLDQLLKMGYGDIYDDIDIASKERIKSTDIARANEYFYHLQRKIIPVGQDFDMSQAKTITDSIGGCFFKMQSKLNSVKPEFIAELSALTEIIEKSCSSKPVASIGQILPGSSKENVHNWMHNSTWYQPDPGVNCSNDKICGHKHNYIIYGGPGIYALGLSNVLALVDEQRSLQIITPIKTNQNVMADGTGAFQRTDEYLNFYIDGNSTPLRMKLDTYSIINDYQVLKLDSKLYYVLESHRLKLTKVMTIVGPFKESVPYPQKLIKHDTGIKVTLHLPDIQSFMGEFTGLNYVEQEFELNVSLFKYLCLRNTTGKVSHDTLRSYAVGFSLRRFVVHSKVISNPTIVYQDIDIHVILSRVCMMKLRNCFDISYGYSKFAKLLGPFRCWLGDVETAMTSSFLGLINKLITDALGLEWDVVLKFIDEIRLQTMVDGISSTNFWEKLLSLAENITTEDVKIVDLDQGVSVFVGPNIGSCNHHGDKCHHIDTKGPNRCLCCNMPITEYEFCECCTPSKLFPGNFFDIEDRIKKEETEGMQLTKRNPTSERVMKLLIGEIEKLSATKTEEVKRRYQTATEKIKSGLHTVVEKVRKTVVKEEGPSSAQEVGVEQEDEVASSIEIPSNAEGWQRVTRRNPRDPQSASDRMVTDMLDQLQPITISADSAEAIQILGYDFVQHCLNTVEYENKLNDGTKTLYTLPHIPIGDIITQNQSFEIVSKITIPNSDAMTCAFDAYKYGYPTANLEEMIALNGGPPPLDNHVIMDYASARSENIIIFGSTGSVWMARHSLTSNDFHCIWFDEPELDGIGHFMPAIIRRIGTQPTCFVHTLPASRDERTQLITLQYGREWSITNPPPNFDGKENLLIELTFYNLHTDVSTNTSTNLLQVVKSGEEVILTNNKESRVHATNRERIHVSLPSFLTKYADSLSLALKFDLTNEAIDPMRHISDELPSNYDYEVEEEFKEILRTFIRVRNLKAGLDARDIKFAYKGKLTSWYGKSKFLMPTSESHKLKRYDAVAIKLDNKIELAYVLGLEGNNVILDKTMITAREVTMYEIKESTGSKLRLLVGLCQPRLNMQQLKDKLAKAQYVTGPAGFGKSTMIANEAKKGDLCVAMTSTAVLSLRDKCKPDVTVISLERAIYDHCKTNNTLFIDEATMVNWIHLGYLCGPDGNIKLYGADHQIGKKDMSATPGVRYNITIKSFLSPKNIKRETHSYRIGEPMIQLLQPVEPGMTTRAKHKTTYNITTLDDCEFENIKTIVTRLNPDIIITPYSHNRNKIQSNLGTLPNKVVTTHSFQGMEVNTALVVLRDDSNRARELNGNPEYLNSALTRAKYHTELVIYGNYGTITDLTPLVRRLGGMRIPTLPTTKIKVSASKQSTELEIDQTTGLPKTINIRSMHLLTSDMVDTLNTMGINNSGVALTYEKVERGTRVTAKLGNSVVSTVTNKEGEIDVQANAFIKRKIMNNLDTNIEIPSTPELDKLTFTDEKMVTVNFRLTNKLRELAWIIDKGTENNMQFKIGKHIIKITKDSGCPLFSGATFECDEEKLRISNGWYSLFDRKVFFDSKTTYVKLSPILTWLDLQVPELFYKTSSDIDWLDVLKGDMVHALWQFQERLTQIHLWFLNYLTGDPSPKCYFNNVKNVARYNKLMRSMGSEPITSHQSVVYHENFIMKSVTRWRRATKYTLGSADQIIAEVSTRDAGCVWRMFAVESLADMRHSYPKCKGIGGTDFDIPGLLIPLHKHMAKNTAVHQLVSSNLAKLKEQIQPHMHDLIRMDKQGLKLIGNYMSQKYPKMTLTTGSYELINSPIEIAMEQIMLNMMGSLTKDTPRLVAYSGYVPLTVAMLGKYYIKLVIPELEEYGRFYYDISKPQLDSMIAHFNSIRDKKVDFYTSRTTNLERLLMGTRLTSLSPKEVDIALNNCKTVYGWLPMFKKSTDNYGFDHKSNLIYFKHGKVSNPINSSMLDGSLSGKPIIVNNKDNYYLEMSTMTEAFDHRLVQITRKEIPIERYIDRRIGSYSEMNNIIKIKVPWIDLDLLRVMSDRQIVTIKELTINKKLLRNILLRLMTGEDSHDDALSYARTLESTQVITEGGIDDMSSTNMLTTLNTTWYAIYIHNDYLKKFKMLISALNSTRGHPLAVGLLEQLITGFSKFLGMIGEVAQGLCETLITKLNKDFNLTNRMADCIDEAQKTNWMPDVKNVYFNRFYFTKEGSNDVTSWFESKPDDKPDDDKRKPYQQDDASEEENSYFNTQKLSRFRQILATDKPRTFSHPQLDESVLQEKAEEEGDLTDYEDVEVTEPTSLPEVSDDDEEQTEIYCEISIENLLLMEQEIPTIHQRRELQRNIRKLSAHKRLNQDEIGKIICKTKELINIGQTPEHVLAGDLVDMGILTEKEKNTKKHKVIDHDAITVPIHTGITKPKLKSIFNKWHMIPKIIWTYWHSNTMSKLVGQCVKSVQVANPDYEVILLTEENLSRFMDVSEMNNIKHLKHENRADWIRLQVLITYGGVWVDATSIGIDNFDELLEMTALSASGVTQVSFSEKDEFVKLFENWMIISTPQNPLLHMWLSHLKTLLRLNFKHLDALDEYMNDNYERYDKYKKRLGPESRLYLLSYLIEMVIIGMTRMEPNAILADDRLVDVHHEVKWQEWNQIPSIYFFKNERQFKVPIIKIISTHKHIIEYCRSIGFAAHKDSWMYQLERMGHSPIIVDHEGYVECLHDLVEKFYPTIGGSRQGIRPRADLQVAIQNKLIKVVDNYTEISLNPGLEEIISIIFSCGLTFVKPRKEFQKCLRVLTEKLTNETFGLTTVVDIVQDVFKITLREFFRPLINNMVPINRTMQSPPNTEYIVVGDKRMPKIIWSYWDETIVNRFQVDMIDNWHYHNQDYRIIILNKTILSRQLSKQTYELIMAQTPQYRSDWVRLHILSKLGGVWVDSTGIFQDTIHPLVMQTLQHESGVYQVSIQSRTKSPRYYESWFIIASERNVFMNHWFENFKNMTNHVKPSGSNALDWMEKNFGQYYHDAKNLIVPNLRVYLRVCLVGAITSLQLKIEPLSLCVNEGRLTMFHDLPKSKWLNLWGLLTEEPAVECNVTFPFIKWIGMQRNIIFRKYKPDFIPKPDSLLGQQMFKITIPYDVTNSGGLSYPGEAVKREREPRITISQYHQANILILCIGSAGDIIQFLTIYDLLESIGKCPVIVTHNDHDNLVQNRRHHFLNVTAKSIMETIDSKLTRIEIGADIKSYQQMQEITKELDVLTTNYRNNIQFLIINSAIPNLSCFSEEVGHKIIEISTFPTEWMFGDTTSEDTPGIGLKLKKWVFKNLNDRKIMIKEPRRYTYYNSCSQLLYPEGENFIGPLTIWSHKVNSDQINLKDNEIFITFGSCDKAISEESKLHLFKNLVSIGYKLLYHDPYRIYVVGTKFFNEVNEMRGKIRVIESFDLRKITGNDKTMINHGGHGTVIESLLAGFKLIIHPVIADQFHWAKRLKELKLATMLTDIESLENCKDAVTELNRLVDFNEKLGAFLTINTIPFLNQIDKKYLAYNPGHSLKALGSICFVEQKLKLVRGVYRISKVMYSVKFNPQVADHCVLESTLYQLSPYGLEEFYRFNNLSANKLKEPAVTEQDLINGVLSLGINLAIIYNNGTGIVYRIFPGEYLIYHIDRSRIPWHVGVPEVAGYEMGDQIDNLAPPVKNLPEDVKTERDKLLLDHTTIELTNPRVLALKMGKKYFKNLMARMQGFNLCEMGNRSDIHCLKLDLRRHGFTHVGDCKGPDHPLTVGCITSNQGWMLVNWQVKNNQIIIYGEQGIYSTSILVNLHMQMQLKSDVKTILQPRLELVSLNKATKQHTIMNNLVPRSSVIYNSHMKTYKLVVSDYDNRDHHMFDELTVIQGATEVYFHSNRRVTVKEFEESHNKGLNRLVLRQGLLGYEHYFDDVYRGRLILNVAPTQHEDKGKFHTDLKLTKDKMEFVNYYFYAERGIMFARDDWRINGIEILESRRVTDIINTSVILTEGEKLNLNAVISKHRTWEVARMTDMEFKITPITHIFVDPTGVIHLQSYMTLLRPPKQGGNDNLERQWWKMTHEKPNLSKPVPGDWWGLREKSIVKPVNKFLDVMAMNELHYHDPTTLNLNLQVVDEEPTPMDIYIAPYEAVYPGSLLEPLTDFPDNIAMQLWEDTDLTNWLSLYAPLNSCVIKSRELPGQIIKSEKLTMNKYPIRSRAVLTKVCFEEGRSIIGRMKSVAFIRTKTPNPYRLVLNIADTYFRRDWQQLISNFRNDLLIIRPKDVQKWVSENKDSQRIEKELIELLCGELISKPINDVNVHLKLESLLKENTTIMTIQQQARIIVWQRKAVCAIYSNLFVEVKRRLKEILHRKIVYADGLRPDELSARVRLAKNVVGFFENDLTKQDRQTDKPIIEVEMMLYDLLGVHPNVIASWKEMHEVWRFKSNLYWGEGEGMRLTGQATTALGNCITNLQVHQQFTHNNFSILQLGLFLGDDMCMVFSEKPDTTNLRKDIATEFNMQSKDSWMINGATFCSMVMCRTLSGAELAPDVVRLKFRYEVPNGVHEATANNLLMRKASYLMMLGKGPHVNDTIKALNLPIKPISWYNFDSMVTAVGHKYNMSDDQVRGYYDELIRMIRSDQVYSHVFRHFSNK